MQTLNPTTYSFEPFFSSELVQLPLEVQAASSLPKDDCATKEESPILQDKKPETDRPIFSPSEIVDKPTQLAGQTPAEIINFGLQLSKSKNIYRKDLVDKKVIRNLIKVTQQYFAQ